MYLHACWLLIEQYNFVSHSMNHFLDLCCRWYDLFLNSPIKQGWLYGFRTWKTPLFFSNTISSKGRLIFLLNNHFVSFYSLCLLSLFTRFPAHSSLLIVVVVFFFISGRPTVVFAAVMWLFQLFLSCFVFSDRDFSITAITVDNRCNDNEN